MLTLVIWLIILLDMFFVVCVAILIKSVVVMFVKWDDRKGGSKMALYSVAEPFLVIMIWSLTHEYQLVERCSLHRTP